MNTDISGAAAALGEVIEKLVGPDGCPWDREQTPMSLADYLIEECHELAAAIRANDNAGVLEELGDVAFLLFFIAARYEKQGIFSLADALDASREKMIRRHPHVFGDAKFENREELLKSWEAIKKNEHASHKSGVFASLPSSLPPLIKAYRINSRAARAGFTWPEDEEVERQVESEWLELLDAFTGEDKNAWRHELGDMLFSLVELGRRKGIKASEALDLACIRFLARFSRMEELAKTAGKDLSAMSLDEMDGLWNTAKQSGAGNAGTDEDGA